MEDGVDLRCFEQRNSVCHLTNTSLYWEWTEVPEGELMASTMSYRTLDVRLEFNVYQVTHYEDAFRAIFVCLVLHSHLSSQQM